MQKKKKKIDHEALGSGFMQIPCMKVEIARGLLDSGIRQTYELSGRAPEVLLESILTKHPELGTIPDLRERIQIAVCFAEEPDAPSHKLKVSYWTVHNG